MKAKILERLKGVTEELQGVQEFNSVELQYREWAEIQASVDGVIKAAGNAWEWADRQRTRALILRTRAHGEEYAAQEAAGVPFTTDGGE